MVREELAYNISPKQAEESWSKLNSDQRAAAEAIMRAVDNPDEFPEERLFFLNGPGGTGKTMVQNTVMERIRSQGKVALAVASSGIASTLLEGGRTVYSRFKIPLDAEETSYCEVKKGTNLAKLLKRAKVIF